MYTPTCRVVELPEIVELICIFTEKPYLVKLLTVSRHFFYCAAPLIWRDVAETSILLDLLPALCSDDLGLELQPYNQAQLARFNIYAPFVQNIDSGTDDDWKVANWLIVLEKVPIRPVLPNLRALGMHPWLSEQNTSWIVKYIEAFLCPNLSDIRMGRNDWGLNIYPDQGAHLLAEMARICPNLTKLCMHVEESQHFENLRFRDMYTRANPLSLVSQFLDLRVFSTSSVVLDPGVLQLLGRLPCLESLQVLSVMDNVTSIANIALSAGSFPSLQHLKLTRVSGLVMSTLWRTPPLVRNLVSVGVKFMLESHETVNRLICDICQGSPLITDLDLNFSNHFGFELSATAVDCFRQLPLERVRFEFGRADCQHLVSALPNVQYLSMDSLAVRYEDLVLIPKAMPKLQYLFAHLVFTGWPSDLPHNYSSPSPCHINSEFAFKEKTGLDKPNLDNYIGIVARTLHSLWPRGVRCGFYSYYLLENKENDALERMNEMIGALSGTSALHLPSVEELKSKWMYVLW
ncbi:hypothetical protein BDV93DRAFT_603555 [Ceratobasidium sp. AG-I]|nr:hypothetical protein BDV93DRAFT_603555 [Ceratobasidium sp. AG-I]